MSEHECSIYSDCGKRMASLERELTEAKDISRALSNEISLTRDQLTEARQGILECQTRILALERMLDQSADIFEYFAKHYGYEVCAAQSRRIRGLLAK